MNLIEAIQKRLGDSRIRELSLPKERGQTRIANVSAQAEPGIRAPAAIPHAEWKAKELNRLFQEQGALGEPARITAETFMHGMKVIH